MVLDAGVLVEAVLGSSLGLQLVEALKGNRILAYVTEVGVAELRYIVCRKLGTAESKERVDKLLGSGYVQVEDASFLVEAAARLKCERAVSLADCFCLALAQYYRCSALFSRRAAELVKEMQKRTFDVEIVFLEDCSLGGSWREVKEER
jgi:predicted nucleic acid-binding protein